MKKQKKMPSPKARLIVEILLSLLVPWCFLVKAFIENSISQIWIFLISAVLIVISIFSYIKEIRQDKKSRQSMDSLKDDSYFSSSEWRQNYLEYVQKHPFETPKSRGMKADLYARYRRMNFHYAWFLWFIGILMFPLAIFLYHSLKNDDDLAEYAVFRIVFIHTIPGIMAILGVVIICKTIKLMKEDAVKDFYRWGQAAGNIDEIESSYENGKMLSHKFKKTHLANGINIGAKYTVIYNITGVYLIENSQILSIARHVIRYKNYYKDLLYQGEEYRHELHITLAGQSEEYDVTLDEFQVEMALAELSKYAEHRDENVFYEEDLLLIEDYRKVIK